MTNLELGGLHHVTAVTGRARANLDFYTKLLGLRLVKKTVNQDVTSAYHLFYADGKGTAGTDMTFFDWPNVPSNQAGAGEVSATAFIIPKGSSQWWQQHLAAAGSDTSPLAAGDGHAGLAFVDGEGQRLELREGENDEAEPWAEAPVPVDQAIRGLASVTLSVSALEPTVAILEQLLNFRRVDGDALTAVFECGPGGLGAQVKVEAQPNAPRAHTGIGGVHHVAFRAANDEIHQAWRERIAQARMPVTEVIDRYYFKSIYFREPGGVLFEIATDGPGFAQDEDMAHLGEGLSLPPFLEPRRAEIEAQLDPL